MEEGAMTKLSICADTVVQTPRSQYQGKCLNIANGIVKSLTSDAQAPLKLDYRGQNSLLVPSPIDLHVHLRGLLQRYKEDAYTGTLAAVAGGVGIVVDMPNTVPPLDNPRSLQEKLDELDENALVDYAVYAAVPQEPSLVDQMVKKTVGFKLYPEDFSKNSRSLCAVLRSAEEHDRIVVVHAELPEISRHDDGWSRDTLRPCHSEHAVLHVLHMLLHECNARPHIHITHVSCAYTVELAEKYGFTTDTTPHHLYADTVVGDTCSSKVNPPLRPPEASKLRQLLIERRIQCIASDHAPHSAEEKRRHPAICPPGIASLDHWPRLLIQEYRSLGLDVIVEAVSTEPARILGIGRTGCLEPGCKAYATVYIIDGERIVENRGSKAKTSIYFMRVEAQLAALLVRGFPVYERDHGLLADKGYGVNIALQTPS